MSREAMKLALEALEEANQTMSMEYSQENYYLEEITALRQALETEKQEPVAWANSFDLQNFDMKVRTGPDLQHTVPLYTAPQKKEWVGLTDEEIITHFQNNVDTGSLLSFADGARYAEAKLREKNT